MLVGMVALAGQWWLDVRQPAKGEVAARMVNLVWNGLTGLTVVARPSTSAIDGPRAPTTGR